MLPRGAILLRRASVLHVRVADRLFKGISCSPAFNFSTKRDEFANITVANRSNFSVQHDGLVILKDSDGIFYSGGVVNGLFNGKGTCTKYQHETYSGEFVDGKRCGSGKVLYHKKPADASIVQNSTSTELAVHSFSSSSLDKSNTDNLISYEGEWKDDKYHGHGLLKFQHGAQYDGSFVDGLFEGSAEYKFENGDVYVGMFHNDTAHGRGKFNSLDGDCYVGDFSNGVFHGNGKYDMNNDMTYDGEWQNGHMHGEGRLYNRAREDVNLYKGRFAFGEFVEGEGPPPGAENKGVDGMKMVEVDPVTGDVINDTIEFDESTDFPAYTEEDLERDLKKKEILEGDGFPMDGSMVAGEQEDAAEDDGDEQADKQEENEKEEQLSGSDEVMAREFAEEVNKMGEEYNKATKPKEN